MGVVEGLKGVEAVESSICYVDGKKGLLYYRGHSIEKIIKTRSFEEIVYLLWYNTFPHRDELKKFSQDMYKAMHLDIDLLLLIRKFPKNANPMSVLRTCISYLGAHDMVKDDYGTRIDIMGKSPAIVAAFDRLRREKKPLKPRKNLNFAANFIYMVTGKIQSREIIDVFDKCLSIHAEHELNASTFAARVTASTLSDVYSCITSAIATLKGPLHGGANERVYDMLVAIKTPNNVKKYVRDALKQGKRIMGFGHRVYRTVDPRSKILKQYQKKLPLSEYYREKVEKLHLISIKLEKEVWRKKRLYANIDFYTPVVYDCLGFSKYLFTPIFAIARNAGWIAHINEQYSHNKLIRPRAKYVGKLFV